MDIVQKMLVVRHVLLDRGIISDEMCVRHWGEQEMVDVNLEFITKRKELLWNMSDKKIGHFLIEVIRVDAPELVGTKINFSLNNEHFYFDVTV